MNEEQIEDLMVEDLLEMRSAGLSWNELRKLIDTLEENEAEARAERCANDHEVVTLDEICEKAKKLK